MRLLAIVGIALLFGPQVLCGQTTRPESAAPERFLVASPAAPVGYATLTVDGKFVEIGGRAGDRSTVLCFLDVECPIARKSIPKLNALAARAAKASIDVFGVISDPFTSRKTAERFRTEFSVEFPLIFDASGAIAVTLAPQRVPEAFVLDPRGRIEYRGRIDDEFVAVGRARTEITSHDLRDAVDAMAAGQRPKVSETTAVGCIFEAWKDGVLPFSPTYARDIRPIVDLRCGDCHRAGSAAPFALDSFESLKKRAGTIREVIERRFMPPFPPIGGHRIFVDDIRLTDRERETFVRWIDGAMPEGDADDLPPLRSFAKTCDLGEPDLLLEVPEEFEIPASGPDLIRVFVLPTGSREMRFVRALELRPSDPTVVHHALFMTDVTGAGRALDAEAPGPGYPRFGGVGFDATGFLGGHLPGVRPFELPDGTAFRLDAEADFILQVHYHPVGRVVRDRPKIALWFARGAVKNRMLVFPVATQDIDIPAGDPDYRRDARLILPADIELRVITPHMHDVARSMVVRTRGADGTVATLLRIDDWDFRRQRPYFLKQPLRLRRGTTIEVEAHYDNSEKNPRNPSHPPARVVFGDQANFEMCMAVLGFTVDPAVEKLIEDAYPGPKRERR